MKLSKNVDNKKFYPKKTSLYFNEKIFRKIRIISNVEN